MKVKSESEVAQSCLTLSNLMDCSLPSSSIHRIFQARVLEWGAIVTLGVVKKEEKYQSKILLLKWFNKHYSNELKEQRIDNLMSDYGTD